MIYELQTPPANKDERATGLSVSPGSRLLRKLHLHVKTEYFDQIKSGAKTEEYRLHNAYWVKRLVEFPEGKARPFDAVVIYNAYKPGAENRIEFPWRGWRLTGRTHPHFGPDEVTVFAIKLDSANDPVSNAAGTTPRRPN